MPRGLNSQKTWFKKGQKPWNAGLKGIHLSPETEFKKGCDGFIGRHSKETKEKLKKFMLGRRHSVSTEFKRGQKPWNYKGDKETENNRIRHSDEYKKWRRAIYVKDCFTCQDCGHRFTNIVAHHIKSFSEYKDLWFDLENGVTLCRKCHLKLHRKLRKEKIMSPNRDGTGRLSRGKNCDATAKADRAGRGRGRGQGGRRRGRKRS